MPHRQRRTRREVPPPSCATVSGAARAIGAVVARFVHTEEVTGSNPVSPTSIHAGQRPVSGIGTGLVPCMCQVPQQTTQSRRHTTMRPCRTRKRRTVPFRPGGSAQDQSKPWSGRSPQLSRRCRANPGARTAPDHTDAWHRLDQYCMSRVPGCLDREDPVEGMTSAMPPTRPPERLSPSPPVRG